MPEAVIVAYGRSPIGRAGKGSLVEVRPDDLAAHVTSKVLQKVPQLDRATIDDLMCGCGLPAGEQGFNLGRAVSILSRFDVPGTTVNRYCASSLQSSRMAFHAIKAGEGEAFLSVGVECVSRYVNGYADQPDAQNPRLQRGNSEEYPDIYIAMEVLATLKPSFRENGRVTAGNACPLNDGAAAVVITSDRKAKELGLTPLARIIATGVSALEPEIMGLGPIEASRQALKRAKMTIDDVDIVEINEAFAAQG